MIRLLIFFCFLNLGFLQATPNCQLFKEDTDCYQACQLAIHASKHKQGSAMSQSLFDLSIGKCPSFAYSYMEKAVPYLKRGQFVAWKKLIDQAVDLSPVEYLGYRSWCRLQFLRDYQGAIADLERLQDMTDYDLGYCQTGDYHLLVALGLSYKGINKLEKAEQLIETQINKEGFPIGLYDFYHLGVVKLLLGKTAEAISCLEKQILENDLAEANYQLAIAYKKRNQCDLFMMYIHKAKERYQARYIMQDTYTEPFDKIYFSDILTEIEAE